MTNRVRYLQSTQLRNMAMTSLERLRRNFPICKWGIMKVAKAATWACLQIVMVTKISNNFLWSKEAPTCRTWTNKTITTPKSPRHIPWRPQVVWSSRNTTLASIRASTFLTTLHHHHRHSLKIARKAKVWLVRRSYRHSTRKIKSTRNHEWSTSSNRWLTRQKYRNILSTLYRQVTSHYRTNQTIHNSEPHHESLIKRVVGKVWVCECV